MGPFPSGVPVQAWDASPRTARMGADVLSGTVTRWVTPSSRRRAMHLRAGAEGPSVEEAGVIIRGRIVPGNRRARVRGDNPPLRPPGPAHVKGLENRVGNPYPTQAFEWALNREGESEAQPRRFRGIRFHG